MNKKTINVEHTPTGAEITVEIDFNHKIEINGKLVPIEDYIKMMVEFWSGWKEKLQENEKSYINTFLKNLCAECIVVSIEFQCNKIGVIRHFEEREGWCKLDSSEGIKLLSISQMELSDQEDYEITELMYNSITNN